MVPGTTLSGNVRKGTMNRRELEARPPLAVRVTFEAGRMSADHLADAYELIVPPTRRTTVASCRHQLFNWREALRCHEGARAC